MKYLKHLIALPLLFTTYSQANELTLYGRANISIQSSDDGAGAYAEVKNNSSRIGLKGDYALNDTLSVLYKAEFGIDIDGDSEKGDSITDREQYVGLQGNFGKVWLGKINTMLKQSQGKADLFNRLNGDIKVLLGGENRIGDSIAYMSPSMSGFRLGASYHLKEQDSADNSSSISFLYGDKTHKKTNFYAALARDNNVKNQDITRVTLSAKLADFTIATLLQTQQNDLVEDIDGFMVSAAYQHHKFIFKVQLQRAKYSSSTDKSGVSVGFDYQLAKRTKLYAFFTTFDMNVNSAQSYLGGGIEYNF